MGNACTWRSIRTDNSPFSRTSEEPSVREFLSRIFLVTGPGRKSWKKTTDDNIRCKGEHDMRYLVIDRNDMTLLNLRSFMIIAEDSTAGTDVLHPAKIAQGKPVPTEKFWIFETIAQGECKPLRQDTGVKIGYLNTCTAVIACNINPNTKYLVHHAEGGTLSEDFKEAVKQLGDANDTWIIYAATNKDAPGASFRDQLYVSNVSWFEREAGIPGDQVFFVDGVFSSGHVIITEDLRITFM